MMTGQVFWPKLSSRDWRALTKDPIEWPFYSMESVVVVDLWDEVAMVEPLD
jgi:hypothetical protein